MIELVERATTITVLAEHNELNTLIDDLAFPHPERDRMVSHVVYKNSEGKQGWDGLIRPLRWLNYGVGEILRGHKDTLLAALSEYDWSVDTEKLLQSPYEDLVTDDIPDDLIQAKFALDEDQRKCIVRWLRNGMGVCHVTVAGGKTATFMAAAAMIKRSYKEARFLYITPSERLVKQTFKCAAEFLPDWDISKYGGDSKNNQGTDMVVATQAMLHTNYDDLVDEGWFETFMGVLFDESQHAASESAERILLATTAYFRFGASDTTSAEKPMRRHKIHGLLGPTLNSVAPVSLIQSGRIARPHIYIIDNHHWRRKYANLKAQAEPGTDAYVLLHDQPNVTKGTYVGPLYEYDDNGDIVYKDVSVVRGDKLVTERQPVTVSGQHIINLDGENVAVESRYCLLDRLYDRAITRFNQRNRLIARWVKYFTDQGWQTLVVATRTMHVLILESIICELIDPSRVEILFGQSTSRERDETFEWFKSTPGSVLISPLVKEGVSINELKAGVVADYIGDWEYAKQIIGRFIRKKEDNHAHIAWFIDRQHERFSKGCMRLFDKLQHVTGFYYYYPVIEPEDIENAALYDTEALVDDRKKQAEARRV